MIPTAFGAQSWGSPPVFNNPFREEAAGNRNKRQQLDHLLRVTAPNERITLAGIGLVLLATAAWAFFGSMERSVTLDGLLLLSEARQEAVADDRERVVALVRLRNAEPIRPGMPAAVELQTPDGGKQRVDGEVAGITPGTLPEWLVAKTPFAELGWSRLEVRLDRAAGLDLDDGAPCRIRVVLGRQTPAALFDAGSA